MLEILAAIKTMGDLLGQLKELALRGQQKRHEEEYRQEFERLWYQITHLQDVFFVAIKTMSQTQDVVIRSQQDRIDTLAVTVRVIHEHMQRQLQMGLMQQPTEDVRNFVVRFVDHATQRIEEFPLPLLEGFGAPLPPLAPLSLPTTSPLIDLISPPPPVHRDRPFFFVADASDHTPQLLPPTVMSPEHVLSVKVRQVMTIAPYYMPCAQHIMYDSQCLMAFLNTNDNRIHGLAFEGTDSITVRVRYYRHYSCPPPVDDKDPTWNAIFDLYVRVFRTAFIELPGVGIEDLVARMERGEVDSQFL